jgi:catechol-2,3-dioxygenase
VTHRVAINTWQVGGVPPKPREMAGLVHSTLRFESPERLREVLDRLDDAERRGDAFLVHDPDGNAIALESQ